MRRRSRQTQTWSRSWIYIASLPLILMLLLVAVTTGSAQAEYEQHDEFVADLAAGRLVVAVLKDAIFVGSVENRIEPDTRPPSIAPIGERRLGVLLGAIRWDSPSAGIEWARLDRELPQLHGQSAFSAAPHLQGSAGPGEEAKDLEDIGNGLLERLNQVARNIHGPLDLRSDEPLTDLVLADYVPDYGAEVWVLQYMIQQSPERGEFWNTRVLQPRYTQLWPPGKGEPQTLMEVQYPAGASPTLLELLRQNVHLEAVAASSSEMTAVADAFVHGDSRRISAAEGVPFLRACLNAVTPDGAREEIAVIGKEANFAWLIPPPPDTSSYKVTQARQRPPNAPTLLKPQE
jgi:hypothetical protein